MKGIGIVVTVGRGAVSTRLGLESYLRGCPHVGCGTQPHRVSTCSRCSPRSCPTSSNIIDTDVTVDTIDKMQGEYACLYTKTLKAKNVLEGT